MNAKTKAVLGGSLAGIPSGAFVGATYSDDTYSSRLRRRERTLRLVAGQICFACSMVAGA
jgi:hypothetical protein